MLILVDKHVPYLRGVLEPYAEVRYLEPEEFSPAVVREADALIVRTRTKVNAALLEGSRCRLVCTATIGFDHIDTAWCEAHGIRWTNAPGCNAQAVCDWVEEALFNSSTIQPSTLKTIGVVGVGHVGSLVVEMARRYGLEVIECDPPKGKTVSLSKIARSCDVITFHTPLTRKGDYPTYHLCDEAFLRECKPGALILNASRGGVVDEQALLASGHPYILDTWENEPNLNPEVLSHALLASQHIAGYSRQGKINASEACLAAISHEFGLPELHIDRSQVPEAGDNAPGWLRRATDLLKSNPDQFESLRESYSLR